MLLAYWVGLLALFEKNANQISKNQKIVFLINNESEQHEAQIIQTGQSVDENKTYKAYAKILGHCSNVLPGMYANAEIETFGNQVTSLPSEAIVNFDDKDFIFIFDKNKVEAGNPFTEYRIIEIQKGISEEGYTQIHLPVEIDIKTTRVVIKGAYNLLSAMKNAGEMAC